MGDSRASVRPHEFFMDKRNAMAKLFVGQDLVLDAPHAVQDRGMVTVADVLADFGQRFGGQFTREIECNEAGYDRRLGSPSRQHVIARH